MKPVTGWVSDGSGMAGRNPRFLLQFALGSAAHRANLLVVRRNSKDVAAMRRGLDPRRRLPGARGGSPEGSPSTGRADHDRTRILRPNIPGGRAAREPWPDCSAGRCLSPDHHGLGTRWPAAAGGRGGSPGGSPSTGDAKHDRTRILRPNIPGGRAARPPAAPGPAPQSQALRAGEPWPDCSAGGACPQAAKPLAGGDATQLGGPLDTRPLRTSALQRDGDGTGASAGWQTEGVTSH